MVQSSGDDLADWNNGCWRVRSQVAADGTSAAQVTASTQSPDVALSIRSMAVLFGGMYNARQLTSWGLLAGDADNIRRFDALMATQHAPHCPDHY